MYNYYMVIYTYTQNEEHKDEKTIYSNIKQIKSKYMRGFKKIIFITNLELKVQKTTRIE